MKYKQLFLLFACLIISQPLFSIAAGKYSPAIAKGISPKKKQHFKNKKKAFKSFLKKSAAGPENDKDKKKLPFGVIALISLAVIPIGLLIGTGIGNLLIFFAWLTSIIFGLRGMKKDKNKFLPLTALAIALGLFLSTITFLDTGLF